MKIDIDALPVLTGCGYPPPYDRPCRDRTRQRLGEAAGLTQFGVNLLRLAPGAWSSQRHAHDGEDEFVWVLEGEVVLVTEAGEQVLGAGQCAGFARGTGDAHHLQNRSDRMAAVLEVGSRNEQDNVAYPGIDLRYVAGDEGYRHLDGTAYPAR